MLNARAGGILFWKELETDMSFYEDRKEAKFSDLRGLTVVRIDGLLKNSGEVTIRTQCGRTFKMLHEQNCCEHVSIDDVVGDTWDLLGSPILMAEESSNSENAPEYADDLFLWTFYKLATIKGYVDIRWYGSSNGYYSVEVSFFEEISSRS